MMKEHREPSRKQKRGDTIQLSVQSGYPNHARAEWMTKSKRAQRIRECIFALIWQNMARHILQSIRLANVAVSEPIAKI